MAETRTLRDGTPSVIWPLLAQDREVLRATHRQLSATSRYHRFLTASTSLPEQLLDLLVDRVDGVDHVALVLVALPTHDAEQVVGVARVIRDPAVPQMADLAVTVIDSWQRRGVATALLRPLLHSHRPVGITTVRTQVAADNAASLATLARIGRTRITGRCSGVLDVEVDLPRNGGVPNAA